MPRANLYPWQQARLYFRQPRNIPWWDFTRINYLHEGRERSARPSLYLGWASSNSAFSMNASLKASNLPTVNQPEILPRIKICPQYRPRWNFVLKISKRSPALHLRPFQPSHVQEVQTRGQKQTDLRHWWTLTLSGSINFGALGELLQVYKLCKSGEIWIIAYSCLWLSTLK